MKKLVVLQTPIADCPEYDSIVTRSIPEAHDIKDWSKQLQETIHKYLAIEVETIVEHLAKCSTPHNAHSESTKASIQRAKKALYDRFGVSYIAF